jgi:hypothetical protein
MKPHDTFLQLAATAVDYPLAPPDRTRLEAHLASCPACARRAAAYRGDALAMGHLPAVVLPERRGADILTAALHPAAALHPLRLLVLAALLGLLLLGSLAVGAQLLRRDDDLAVVLPVPTVTPGPDASPSPGPTPGLDSPVGTLVVTHGEGGKEWIELLTMDGAVTRLAEGRDPAWLSDSMIVYTCPSAGETQTGICAVDPGTPKEPKTLIANADRPAPAPDGTSIAIHREMIDVGETWITTADGSNPRLLHSGAFLHWSPDGAWLAGQPESAAYEVAIVGADGQAFRVLAPGYDPAWSPSGDRIAYALVGEEGASLRTVNVSSGEVEILVTTPAGSEVAAPAWLADGRLLYVQDGNIWMFDPAQTAPVQVTTGGSIHGGSIAEALAVSPYGGWVAYVDGTEADALVELTNLAGNKGMSFPWTGPVTQPAWAPKVVPATGEPGSSPAPLGWTWQAASMPVAVGVPAGRVEAVIAGGIGFLAVGRGCLAESCQGIVWRSADGKSWEQVPASDATDTGFVFPMSGPEIGMFDVAVGEPGFVAIGYSAQPTMEATTWFSPDGVTWARNPLGDATFTRVNAVGWDGRQFVLAGEDRSDWDGSVADLATATARAAVWTSVDGRTWTRVPHSPVFDVGGFIDTTEDPATGGMTDVVPGPAGFVAVGSTCTSEGACEPAAWTTGGGDTWERAADMQGLSGQLKAVAASDSGYVAVGSGTCGSSPNSIPQDCPAVIMESSDAQTWRLQPEIPVSDLRTVTRIGDWFFATATSGPETVWVSADGKSWAPLEAEGGPSTNGQGDGVEWRFGADNVTAVWLGVSGAGNPAAWVSAAVAP